MNKKSFSLQQICKEKFKKQNSFLNYKLEQQYICPNCGEESFIINKKYMIGYCTNNNCNIFVDLFNKRNSHVNLENNSLIPIINEAKKHINSKYMEKELFFFNIGINTCKKYNIGYYPILYWPNPDEDKHPFGNIIFPLYDYENKIINICAKYIGIENKLPKDNVHFCYKNKGGIFNVRGIWNNEVNVFLNPIDCLLALSKNIVNSIFVNEYFNLPELIVFDKANIFGTRYQTDIIKNINDKLIKKNIKTNIYLPEYTNNEFWYQYFKTINK